ASNINTRNYFNAFQLATPINGQIFTAGQMGIAGVPSGLPAFGQVRVQRAQDLGGGVPVNDWQTVGRIDYNWSDRTQVYIRGAFQEFAKPLGTISFSPYVGFNTGLDGRNQNYLTSVTHSFSTNMVSQSKVVFNRLNSNQPLGDQPLLPTLYINDAASGQVFPGGIIRLPGYLSDS